MWLEMSVRSRFMAERTASVEYSQMSPVSVIDSLKVLLKLSFWATRCM